MLYVHPVRDDGLTTCDCCGWRVPAATIRQVGEYLFFCTPCFERQALRLFHMSLLTWDIYIYLGPERDVPSA